MSVSGGSDSSSYIETEVANIEKNENILTSKGSFLKQTVGRLELNLNPRPRPPLRVLHNRPISNRHNWTQPSYTLPNGAGQGGDSIRVRARAAMKVNNHPYWTAQNQSP